MWLILNHKGFILWNHEWCKFTEFFSKMSFSNEDLCLMMMHRHKFMVFLWFLLLLCKFRWDIQIMTRSIKDLFLCSQLAFLNLICPVPSLLSLYQLLWRNLSASLNPKTWFHHFVEESINSSCKLELLFLSL